MPDCQHKWVNIDGCLLCGMDWKHLNADGYYFKPIDNNQKEDGDEYVPNDFC